jgi:hypothetical protein
MNQPKSFAVAIEEGIDGLQAAWCLDLAGCFALIRPGEDPRECAAAAIAEFMAWGHQRAASRIEIDLSAISIVQSLPTHADLAAGETLALFAAELQPPTGKEFPLWANAHDLAHDELVDLALGLPASLTSWPAGPGGRTLAEIVRHAAEEETAMAAALIPTASTPLPITVAALVPTMRDAHRKLQENICAVPGSFHAHRPGGKGGPGEDWSVRKAMRRSIWHLRYHTWEARRAMSRNWLG